MQNSMNIDTRSLRTVFLEFFAFFVFHLLIHGQYPNTCCWHRNQINDYHLFCDIIKTSVKERLAQGASHTSWIGFLQIFHKYGICSLFTGKAIIIIFIEETFS